MNSISIKKGLVWAIILLWSCFTAGTFAQDHLPSQVDNIVSQALGLTSSDAKLEKLIWARSKIWKAMLSNPTDAVFHSLETINESIERLISRHILQSYNQERLPSELLKLTELQTATNTKRRERRLAPLQINEKLNKTAEMIANDMVEFNFFWHQTPQWITVTHRLDAVGYEWTFTDIHLAQGDTDGATIINSWIDNPLQERNIFSQKVTEVWYGYNPVENYRVAVYWSKKWSLYYKIWR